MPAKLKRSQQQKILHADVMGRKAMARANAHKEAGRLDAAERDFAAAQYWLDRVHKLEGKG